MRFITVVFFAAVIAFAAAYEITESNPKFGAMASNMKNRVCVPNTYFTKDCNTCNCADDGLSFSCSEYPCPPLSQEDTKSYF
ncbi:uncharacterized protein LOC106655349 [Trichogramma pretiosum]|uniref:uncharacterized protein LOC106655349 n=1 Tax=Trichogramma pretiosum TaxID=7493 RepID=UPI0006C949E0|nr:uncharacterized protein LOC106655349 [Trichogramma pretiosum]